MRSSSLLLLFNNSFFHIPSSSAIWLKRAPWVCCMGLLASLSLPRPPLVELVLVYIITPYNGAAWRTLGGGLGNTGEEIEREAHLLLSRHLSLSSQMEEGKKENYYVYRSGIGKYSHLLTKPMIIISIIHNFPSCPPHGRPPHPKGPDPRCTSLRRGGLRYIRERIR